MLFTRMLTLGLFFTAGACIALAGDGAVTLSVETMICGPDPHIIQQSLRALPGVHDVAISLESRTASVSFDDTQTSVDAIQEAVAAAGYASHPVK